MTNFKLTFLRTALIALLAILTCRPLIAQERCGTVEVLEKKRKKLSIRESDEQFEQWMNQRAGHRKGRAERVGTYTVPVVFHIIHKGEAIGTGVNITDAQLASQVAVLNRDFNRANRDASSTPAEFASVVGNMGIAFVLARQDPQGNPTTGIVRVKGSKNQWSVNDESTLKALSYWPAEDYLNIWVTDLSLSLLGYAQFPVSDLAGLESAEDNRLTDGVVVDYSVVGSNEDGTFNLSTNFNRGRSATHEVGHFFGLRHIWGDDDGSCSGSGDYVDDTPKQGNNTEGCPSHPQSSCSAHTMFQNYMDYTNDVCMNLFTQGQISRMVAVIENSPRRASLLVSPGGEDPAPIANDIALKSFVSPAAVLCETSVKPVLSVSNNGTQPVTRMEIAFSAGSDTVITAVALPQPLLPGAVTTVTLDAFQFQEGTNETHAEVVSVNGTTDGKPRDNSISGSTYLYYRAAVPYNEAFNSIPQDWRLSETTPAWTTSLANGNGALFLNGHGTSGTDTATATTPLFSIPEGQAYLIFDNAYAQTSAADFTRLSVYALDACSDDVTLGKLLFNKSGSELATVPATSASFVPTILSWRQEAIDLSAMAGRTHVRFAIVAYGENENNIYIDNFQVVGNIQEDVELVDVTDFSPVSCGSSTSAKLTIQNNGSSPLHSVQISYYVNGEPISLVTLGDLSLWPGAKTSFPISDIPTTQPMNFVGFQVLRPNGFFDVHDNDNSHRVSVAVNGDTDMIPNRQSFENGPGSWTSLSPYGGNAWSLSTTNLGGSMQFQGSNDEPTRTAWLVSPLLDFSSAAEASVVFDVSRLPATLEGLLESRADSSDTLSIMTSVDCGFTYRRLVSMPLSYSSQDVLLPEVASHWSRRFINLSELAREGDVRVAFVLNHATASTYLDNVEFFLSADSTPVAADQPFTVYGTDPSVPDDFYITFHLDDRQDVSYRLLDMTGRALETTQLTDVLNQTYQVRPRVSAGIYLLRIQIGTQVYTQRVFIDQ